MYWSLLEWRVENFGCWNMDFHDCSITSPPDLQVSWGLTCSTLELYPRGLTGSEEYMVLRVCYKSLGGFSGDIAFIGSDGRLLCVQQVDFGTEEGVLIVPPGPKFQDVVTEIEKNEATHEDGLTVRLRIETHVPSVIRVRTKIKVVDVTFKTRPSTFLYWRTDGTVSRDDPECLSGTCHLANIPPFTSDDGTVVAMVLRAAAKESIPTSKVGLALIHGSSEGGRAPFSFFKNVPPERGNPLKDVLVYTRVSVLGAGTRSEVNSHVFAGETKWSFFKTLMTRQELGNNEGVSLTVRVKIVPSRKFKHKILFEFDPETVDVMPTFSHRRRLCQNDGDGDDNALAKDLSCLYLDRDFSDFQLKCGDVSFPVHKAILGARSPVFKTMLSVDMKEAASSCMDITDLDPSTLGLFLTYLYTGALNDLQSDSALKLYYVGDKYQVPTLKKVCGDFLCAHLTVSNVCDVLTLADQHQDERMRSAALDFVKKMYNAVITSKKWEVFLEEEPLLAAITLSLTERRGK